MNFSSMFVLNKQGQPVCNKPKESPCAKLRPDSNVIITIYYLLFVFFVIDYSSPVVLIVA